MTRPPSSSEVPAVARRLLAAAIHSDDRRYALADLEEGFERRLETEGRRAARRWYRSQVARSVCPALASRIRRLLAMGRSLAGVARADPRSDLKHASRIVTQTPVLAATAVATLALGVAAPTTMFSITTGILRDLPFESPHRIVAIERDHLSSGRRDIGVTARDFLTWRDGQSSFVGLAAVDREIMQLNDERQPPARYEGAAITPGGLELLGVEPALGRSLMPGDALPGSPPVVLISHQVWERRYGFDPDILGATVRVNGEMRVVVGVMPGDFGFPRLERLWIPLVVAEALELSPFNVFGRLRDGATLETAQAELDVFAGGLAASYPESHDGVTVRIEPYASAALGSDAGRVMLSAMTLLLSFVLIVACVNVANLLLARAMDRTREVALRMALGAGRGRVIREVLAEATIVALLGGVGGVGLAYGAIAWFNQRLGDEVNLFWLVIRIDRPVLLFAGGLVVGAALVAGVLPALQASSVNLSAAMSGAWRGATRFRSGRASRWLIAAEVALSCSLLIVSSLMVKGALSTTQRSPDFQPEGVLTSRLDAREFDFPLPEDRARFAVELERRFADHPAVAAVALASRLPGRGGSGSVVATETTAVGEIAGQMRLMAVSPSFFPTFNVDLLEGRTFTGGEPGSVVREAAVTPAFAARFFGDEPVLGRRFKIGTGAADAPWWEIVGLVEDGGIFYERGEVHPGVYVPLSVSAPEVFAVALRAKGDPRGLAPVLRDVVEALSPHVPLHEIATLNEVLARESVAEETLGTIFGVFGLAALIMAAVGLYGVVSFGVSQRAQEIGIRRALGAGVRNVVWVTLRSSLLALAGGVVVGSGVAYVLAPAMGDVLFGSSPHDPGVYFAIVAVLGVAALAASVGPSLRAAQVDPMKVLR